MAKVYSSKRDAKELARTAKPGDVLYTIVDNTARYPGAERQLYSTHVVGRSRGVTGAAMLEGPGYTSVEQLVYSSGPVYTEKPRNMRNIADPAPQVSGPLGLDSDRPRNLSRAELHDLEKDNQRNREDARRTWWA